MNTRALILAIAAVAATSAAAATKPSTSSIAYRSSTIEPPSSIDQRAIDTLFAPFSGASPGCAVGVFQNGAVAFAKGYGMASLEHDVPITADSVFYAGSVSKQFTAFAAALAIKQGKLAYEDPIRKYLPELPGYADAIRVRHLLHHTSGLRDYNTLLSIAGRRDEEAWDNRAVLRITARQKALNFEPGSEYLYSNTGYTLLATIVERATGTPFADFVDAQIFKPLGMTSSHFHTDARRLVRHRALGYGGRSGAWTLDTPINERAGAGGLYTSIRDLQKWDENFYTGKVGGMDVIKMTQTRGRLDDSSTMKYAWGLQSGEFYGLPIVEHSGALGGYRAHLLRVPSMHTSVALLCNTATVTTPALVRDLARIVLAGRLPRGLDAPPPAGLVPGSEPGTRMMIGGPSSAHEYAGTYYSDELEATFTITSDGKHVFLQRESDAAPVLLDAAGDSFRVRGTTIRFAAIPGEKVTRFTIDAGRVRGIVFERMAASGKR